MAGFDITSLLNQLMGKQQQQQPQQGQPGEQGRTPAPANAMGAAPGGAAGGLGNLLSSGMVQKLAPMITGLLAGGGLSKLMEGLKGAGAGSQATSWVSADQPNQPVSGEQITRALGPEQISQVANTLGMTNEQAAHTMAAALPQVVDAMTPDGHLPEEAGSAAGPAAAGQSQNRPQAGGASGETPQGG